MVAAVRQWSYFAQQVCVLDTVITYVSVEKLRPYLTVLLAFWLAFGPVATAWAASAPTPCESMGDAAPGDDCCGGSMDTAACLSACVAAFMAVVAPAMQVQAVEAVHDAIPGLSLRYATYLAPPDVAPPKPSVC